MCGEICFYKNSFSRRLKCFQVNDASSENKKSGIGWGKKK